MRNMILGTVAGLLVGGIGAFAYSQYVNGQLADVQKQLDDTNAKLVAAKKDASYLQEKYNSATEQLTQVQLDKGQTPASGDKSGDASATPAGNPMTIGGVPITQDMIRGFMAMMPRGNGPGGFRMPEQRMLLLQARLKLSPDQAKQLKDAMTADDQARREAYQQARENHQPPDLTGANTLDTKLTSILTPAQQVQYQQVQSDEKAARAETAATQQIDNLAPLLQLSDDQKEKAMAALYQQQLNAPDPATLRNDPNFLNTLSQQGQGTANALKSVLSSDQYSLYQQNDQLTQQGITNLAGRRNGANGNGNGNGRGQGQGQGQGQTLAQGAGGGATPNVAATGTTTASTGTDTTASSTNAATGTTTPDTASATNAATATTNAATSTPPAAN